MDVPSSTFTSPMKVSVSRDALVSRLQIAGRAVSTRTAVPSLGGILVEAGETGLTLRATDMEVGLVLDVEAKVESPGSVLLPGRLLVDVVRNLPAGDVTLALRPEQRDVELTAGTARFHLRTLPPEDFPRLPQFEGEPIKLPADALADTVDRVALAASRDEVRPILTGVLVTAEDRTLTMVATDSYRLSVKETRLGAALPDGFEANVPARALEELSRLVRDDVDDIRIGVRANQVVFEVDGLALSSRLIDGQFPNYRQLLPEAYEHELTINREELLEVVRRISLMAQKNAPLRLAFSEGEVSISAQTPDVGEASEPVPIPFAGEPFDIGFNPDFLIAGLESAGSEDVVLKLISPLRPGLLESADGSGFLYLIMPIRLNV
jgi:DNA polymerase III subunit beta